MAQESDVLTVNWSIENFSMCPYQNKQFWSSPCFTGNIFGKAEFVLRLYPRGFSDDINVACHLVRVDHREGDLALGFIMHVVDQSKSDPTFCKHQRSFIFNKETHYYGYDELISCEEVLKRKERFLPGDVFTVRCHIWFCNLGNLPFDCNYIHSLSSMNSQFETTEEYSTEHLRLSDANIVTCMGKSVPRPSEIFARSRIPIERRCAEWSIKNFSSYVLGYKHFIKVEAPSKGAPSLILELYATEDHGVQIEIRRAKEHQEQVFTLTCKISVFRNGENSNVSAKATHFFKPNANSNIFYFPLLIKNKLVENRSVYLPNDVLTLHCEFIFFKGVECSFIEDTRYISREYPDLFLVHPDSAGLKNELIQLYREHKFCDITLQAQDRSIEAHKVFLCSQSDVFKAMFESNMLESGTNVVCIDDIDGDTLDKMLLFLYSDTLPSLQLENAVKLFVAADKYQILKLKKKCSNFLQQNLTTSNLCEILAVADMHQDKDLLLAAVDFICFNKRAILTSAEWKQLMLCKPQFVSEIITEVCLMLPDL